MIIANMLTLKFDDKELRKKLQHVPSLADEAVRGAIRNTLAFDVAGNKGSNTLRNYMDGTLRQYVDRPTPFTSDGKGLAFYATVPEKKSGPLEGKFGVKGIQGAYIQFIAKGVPRDNKIIERRSPDGILMVPAKKMKLDKYGNVPRKIYERIYNEAFSSAKNKQFFYLKKGGKIPPGIYERKEAGGVELKFLAVNEAKYRKQWDFFGLAQDWIEKRLPIATQDALSHELKKGF